VSDADDQDERGKSWHNQAPVVWAAGAAAVLLLGILIYAVLEMSSGGSPDTPAPGGPLPSYVPQSGTRNTTSSTPWTSYTVPSVQTSQDLPGAPSASTDPSSSSASEPDTPTPTTPTTIFNPYVTTTNPAAGHV
jgi:hypothetical protein